MEHTDMETSKPREFVKINAKQLNAVLVDMKFVLHIGLPPNSEMSYWADGVGEFAICKRGNFGRVRILIDPIMLDENVRTALKI